MMSERRKPVKSAAGAAGVVRGPARARATRGLPRHGRSRIFPALLLLPAVAWALLSMSGCASSGSPALGTASAIQVILTQEPASPLQIGSISSVIATVLDDPHDMGVDWQVSCTVAKCGTFTPAHTTSGAVTMYTAPTSVPSQLGVSAANVNLTAVSTADPTKSVTVTLSIAGPPITVAFSAPAPPATLQTNSAASLNATIVNDVASAGADWTLSCAGKGSACGSLTSSHTPDNGGTLVSNVYAAPAAIPPGGGYVTLTVTASADKTKSASATIQITAPPVTVTFSQVPSTVPAGSTASVTATVANDPSNKGVSWSVSCGSSDCGSFNPAATASGTATTYTAPVTPPTGSTVTIKATSVASSSASVTSIVTITAPQAVSISYTSPPPSSLQTGAQASIIAMVVNDTSNAGVDWSVTCGSGSTSCGTFSLTHTVSGGATTFTAPLTSPSGGSITITATATATDKSSSPATAVATVAINSAGRAGLLVGQYAFSLSGADTKGFYASVGSVILDGNGNVKSGEQDFADTAGVHPASTLTGTYLIGNDGRGTMTLTSTDAAVGVNGVETFDFAVVSSEQALVVEFDTSATSSGSLVLQTPSSFSQMAVTGGYSFTLSGVDLTKPGTSMDLGGVLSADGKGNFTGVAEDVNDGGTVSSATPAGSYTVPDAYGRGTATLGTTATYAYYVVDSGAFRLLETDTSGLTVGSAFSQGTTPTFTVASLSGPYAFTAQGKSGRGALAIGGLLSFDGKGNVTSGTALDVNNAGTISSPGNPTGTYTVASNGRGTVTLSPATGGVAQFALYLTASQGPLMLELDSGLTSAGAAQSQASAITAATFKGSYAGLLDLQPASGENDSEAEVSSDGVSVLTGTADLNSSGAPAPLASGTGLTGSFTANSNGRFTGSLTLATTPATNLSGMFYVVNGSTVLFTDLDTSNPGTGQLQLQQFSSGPAVTIAFTQGEDPPATMDLSAMATMAATVTNDTGQGVNWTVSCGGSDCGSFNPTHTASGATTTYTAPNANVTATITATAVADQTQHVQSSVIVGSGSPGISIAFTAPPPTSLQIGTSSSITATVSNDPSNAGVNWSVSCEDTACGSFTPSSHTASGSPITYTAPASIPDGDTVTITAAAAASPSTTAVGTTTITMGAPPPPTISVSPGPSNGQLQTSSQWSYSATVTNDSSGVNWSVSCSNGSDGCGSFDPSQTTDTGATVYTAPSKISTGSSVTVTLTASIVDDPSVSAESSLTIVSAGSPGLLGTGWFTFYLAGSNYVVNPDGTGTLTLETVSGLCLGVLQQNGDCLQTLQFVVVDSSRALVMEFDNSATSGGSLDLQSGLTSSGFPLSSITGSYVFTLFGVDNSIPSEIAPFGLGGALTANPSGFSWSGVGDANDDDVVDSDKALSGGYNDASDEAQPGNCGAGGAGDTDPCGRSSATIVLGSTTYNIVYYVVNQNYLKILDVDGDNFALPFVLGIGSMYSAANPAQLSSGNYVFTVEGTQYDSTQTSGPPVAAGGVFTSPGGSSGDLTGVSLDVNNDGKADLACVPTGTTTFSIDSDGRGTLAFGTNTCAGSDTFSSFAIYPTASTGPLNGGVLMLQLDSNSSHKIAETAGTAYPQSTSPSFSGTYGGVFDSTVTQPTSSGENATEQDMLGQVTVSSSSICSGGSSCGTSNGVYINQANVAQAFGPYSSVPLSGSFVNGSNGRYIEAVTITVNGTPYTLNEIFYAGVNGNNTVLSLETDPFGTGGQSYQGPGTGLLQIQNLNDPQAQHLAGRSLPIRPMGTIQFSADKPNHPDGPAMP